MTVHPAAIILLFLPIGIPVGNPSADGDDSPAWSTNQSHRLLVRVDPVNTTRESDEMVARVAIDFDPYLNGARCNLQTLSLSRYDPVTGKRMPYQGKGIRAVRIYDRSIPWKFPERQGYAHASDGSGLPAIYIEGGGRFLPVTGESRQIYLAWSHVQLAPKPAYYAIYFDPLPADVIVAAPIPGFLGDGSNRCEPHARHFFRFITVGWTWLISMATVDSI